MTSTAAIALDAPSRVDVASVDVRDLDASAVLEEVVTARRCVDREEARLLALAVHWVDLHPVTDRVAEATWRTEAPVLVADGTGRLDQAPAVDPGRCGGVPGVAEFAVEEL